MPDDPSDSEPPNEDPIAVPHPEGGGGLWSPRYRDGYRGARGPAALGEVEHVFIAGNRLRERFAALPSGSTFTIGELGFGAGLSCCAAIAAFRACAAESVCLHFVTTEKHPLPVELLERGLAGLPDPIAGVANELIRAWRMAVVVDGMMKLELASTTVFVLVGDVRGSLLAREGWRADAWFLDLFAPARQEGAWEVCRSLGERSRPGSTASTWSVSKAVVADLEHAGFVVRREPGFGTKRSMTVAAVPGPEAMGVLLDRRRRVVIEGAGFAGAAVADALRARGMTEITVTGDGHGPGLPPTAVLQPRLFDPKHAAPDAVVTALAFELARRRVDELGVDACGFVACGVLHVPPDEAAADKLRARQGAGGARWVDAAEAGVRCGVEGLAPLGGLWIPRAGVVRSRVLVDRLLAGVVRVAGDVAGAGILVLAPGAAGVADPRLAQLELRPLPGQLTAVRPSREGPFPRVRAVVCGGGHLTPEIGGQHFVGATYRTSAAGRTAGAVVLSPDDDANIARFRAGLPASVAADRLVEGLAGGVRTGSWSGVRATTPDHLPYVGELPAVSEGERLFVTAGLGSRGAAFAFLAAEVLAAMICGEPDPLRRELQCRLKPLRRLAPGP